MTSFASSESLALPSTMADAVEEKLIDLQIEPATLAELDAVAHLLTESFHQFQPWNAWLSTILARGIRSDLQHRLSRTPAPYTCLLAYAGQPKTLVGTVEISRPTLRFRGQPYLYISNLAVQAEYRRQGIGKQLIIACEAIAQNADCTGLYLHVLKQNHPAQQLYADLGFTARSQFILLGCNITLPSQRQLLVKAI